MTPRMARAGTGLLRPSRRFVLGAPLALALAAAGAPVPAASASGPAHRPVRVLAPGGTWPGALREWIARTHGIRVAVETVADPDEARRRVRRATLDGAQGSPGRAGPVDLVCLGLEDCARWRAEGLLRPLPAPLPAPPVAVAGALRARGALDAAGRAWLLPMTVGFDVMFAAVSAASAGSGLNHVLTPGDGPVPGWERLLNPARDEALVMEPDGAVWMALRLLDPDGARLSAAMTDEAAARELFRDVRDRLQPFRDRLRGSWTDTATFVTALRAAVSAGEGVAGLAWDSLVRRLIRHGMTPSPLARIPAEGAAAWLDGLAMPIGGAAPRAAGRLLALLAQPGAQAVWASASDGIPARVGAWAWLQAGERAWVTRALAPAPEGDDGLARLWFRPRLEGPALARFRTARDRFEFG